MTMNRAKLIFYTGWLHLYCMYSSVLGKVIGYEEKWKLIKHNRYNNINNINAGMLDVFLKHICSSLLMLPLLIDFIK